MKKCYQIETPLLYYMFFCPPTHWRDKKQRTGRTIQSSHYYNSQAKLKQE